MKRFGLLLLWLPLVSCSNEQTVSVKSIQKAVIACRGSDSIVCGDKRAQLDRVQKLAVRLEAAPEMFGLGVMHLQEKLASTQKLLSNAKEEDAAPSVIHKLKDKKTHLQQQYNEHMSVLRWLEAPDS